MVKKILMVTATVLFLAGNLMAMSAEEIISASQDVFYAQGDDSKIRVHMRLITRSGKERVREMTMLRKNYEAGMQKYFIYFYTPSDVRDMTFMVNKYPDRDDDRWLFVPAINMVRRIAVEDKASSFVGSDFTYEDISGRNPGDDTHELLREEPVGGRDCFVIKSTPKAGGMNWSYKLTWVDKDNSLPLKEEYYNRHGELLRVFSADKVAEVQGFSTITVRSMKNLKSGHRTEVTFKKTEYNVGITDDLFSERYMKRPPKRWIR